MNTRTLSVFALGIVFALMMAFPLTAELRSGESLEVKILLDNSGSMYPGYQPPGADGPTLAEAGGRYFFQYPALASWLDDFVAAQSVFGGDQVSMSVLTSSESFRFADVGRIHPPSPLGEFDFERVSSRIPHSGRHTFLAEGLRAATRRFEGLIWLITDNIVEDRQGEPDQGVRRFFEEVHGEDRYRAVHLYKLPFASLVSGSSGTLAVYGILVSPNAVEGVSETFFDTKFRQDFLLARRQGMGGPLFQEPVHWKLKNLENDILRLDVQTLSVQISQRQQSLFRHRQRVELNLDGRVTNLLTQHRIVSGSIRIVPVSPFRPTGKSGKDYGLKSIPSEEFEGTSKALSAISPRQSTGLKAQLRSKKPIPLETEGLGAWFASASKGLTVTYSGRVRAEGTGLKAEFDRSQMAGIFGAEAAPEIFQIEEHLNIPAAPSNPVAVSFQLTSGYGRQLLFVLLMLGLLSLLGLLVFVFGKRARYQIRLAGEENFVDLRRLQSRYCDYQGQRLGTLGRPLLGAATFLPNRASAAVRVEAASTAGRFNVTVRDGVSTSLEIQEVGGDPVAEGQESRASRGRPGRPGGGRPTAGRPGSGRPGGRPSSASPGAPRGSRPTSTSSSPRGGAGPSSPRSSGRPTINRPGS